MEMDKTRLGELAFLVLAHEVACNGCFSFSNTMPHLSERTGISVGELARFFAAVIEESGRLRAGWAKGNLKQAANG